MIKHGLSNDMMLMKDDKKLDRESFKAELADKLGFLPKNLDHYADALFSFIKKTERKFNKQGGSFADIQRDALFSSDDNLFKTMYGALSTVTNFEMGVVVSDKENDKPAETIKHAFNFIATKAKVFHCSEYLRDMLILTDNEIHARKLPFTCMFIDVEFDYDEHITYWGFLLTAVVKDGESLRYVNEGEAPNGFNVLAIGVDKRDLMVTYAFTTVLEDGMIPSSTDKGLLVMLSRFACNFLDFLNDPSVLIVKGDETKLKEFEPLQRFYRSKRIDLNKTYFVQISEPLKRYVDNYIYLRTKRGFSHRFWVRGHFRTLHADRYGENVGKRIWIAPYVKGQGILIEKQYDVDMGVALHAQ